MMNYETLALLRCGFLKFQIFSAIGIPYLIHLKPENGWRAEPAPALHHS